MRTFRNMHAPTSKNTNHRARWAAIGAAVAVSLGAGGLGIARAATNPAGASAYNAITPCRLVDTRAGSSHVGTQAGPLGADGVMSVIGRGAEITDDSTCDGKIPSNATGLQLNVTASEATQATFLTVYPTGQPRPTASNVNVSDANSVPNSATVLLGTDGKFDVFNRFGSVQVIIDVAGFYADHTHDSANITNEAGVAYNAVAPDSAIVVDSSTDQTIITTKINIPSDGVITAIADVTWWAPGSTDNQTARCQITKAETYDNNQPYMRLNDFDADSALNNVTTSGHRTMTVTTAEETGTIISGFGIPINLVCDSLTGTINILSASLTVQFFPTDYTSSGGIFIPVCPPFCIMLSEEEGEGA